MFFPGGGKQLKVSARCLALLGFRISTLPCMWMLAGVLCQQGSVVLKVRGTPRQYCEVFSSQGLLLPTIGNSLKKQKACTKY